MTPLTQEEKDSLKLNVLKHLSNTPYACSSLIHLTSGTTNFVFRGTLTQHFQNNATLKDGGANTVIVKHSLAFAAQNKDLPIDISRCKVEVTLLKALLSFPYTTSNVRIPQFYLFNAETNTLVLEDIPHVTDLKTILVSPALNASFSHQTASAVGHASGSWLRAFHSWIDEDSQSGARKEIGSNESMRELKLKITYESFIEVIEGFPGVMGDNRAVLEEVRDAARKEFRRGVGEGGVEIGDLGIIHGDFWAGNILLQKPLSGAQEKPPTLFIVDYEMAQFGHRAYDIGQMIGDLYERKHFLDIDAAVWVLAAFIEGYGPVSEDMAFRIVIHTGVQLITWMCRGPPLHLRPAWATRERAEVVVMLGMEFVLRGWKRDKEWLEKSVLAGLFGDS